MSIIGLGSDSTLLAVKETGLLAHDSAVFMQPVVNAVGTGDALFSSLLHGYLQTNDPLLALKKAVVFAAYKIGSVGAADGFLTAVELES